MTYAEEDRLLATLPERHRTVTQLALECGARLQSELLPVVWADVNLDRAQLTITATHSKNGRERHLPLGADMVRRLRTMQATSRSQYVFPARGGGLLHRFTDTYFRTVRQLGLAGTGLNIHCLRHTFASQFVEAGGDLMLLMALGGWSSLSMVQRYSHHRPERGVEVIQRMLAAREAARALPQTAPRRITRAPREG